MRPDRIVYCGGLKAPKSGSTALELDTGGGANAASRVNLNLGDISRRMVESVPDVLADLLEIACYVYCADQFTPRDSPSMPRMGTDWHRRFEFHIPVRNLQLWEQRDVQDALVRTLTFLSEDSYTFRFVAAGNRRGLQSYLDLSGSSSADSFVPDRVALFSGGLDSFAGAVETLLGNRERIALVSHQAAALVQSRQAELTDALRQRTASGQLFHVGVTVNKGPKEATEFTQRSRSFLFATLGFVVARLFRKLAISFYENGVVSINVPVAQHVLGARATRTTHPEFLAHVSGLFSLLAEDAFSVTNPFMWLTKSDVAGRIEELGCGDLIERTFSCAHVRDAAVVGGRHCGKCSQCIDRRFGILAAGLEHREPAETYGIDLLTGARQLGPEIVLAQSYVHSALEMARMTETGLFSRYGQIYRALPYLPGPATENAARLHDLHLRHGRAVEEVVSRELARQGVAGLLDLPDTSLLSVIHAPTGPAPVLDSAEREPPASVQAAAEREPRIEWPIRFAVDDALGRVVFSGGIEIGGKGYTFLKELIKEFDTARELNGDPDDYPYIKAGPLSARLTMTDASLRQAVIRLRQLLRRQFMTRFGISLDDDEVVQNKKWFGYRLNPFLNPTPLLVLQKAQAVSRDSHNSNSKMSQLGAQQAAE